MEPAKKMNDHQIQEVHEEAQPEVEASIERGRGRRRRNQPAQPEISVNMDELRELIQLIRENDFSEFELERKGFRVRFRRGVESGSTAAAPTADADQEFDGVRQGGAATGAPASETKVTTTSVPVHPGAKAQTVASEDLDLHIIPSPIVGTFYRAPSPNADSFVKIGSTVEPDTVVCIIEAMKLMNEIQAETTGEVAKIYVENGQPVEYGQPLFGIKR
jgi:acetyl-CoA carboxylase biotin carboxyl carrier protein